MTNSFTPRATARLLAGIPLAALLAAGCKDQAPPAPPAVPVTVGTAEQRVVPLELQATGTVEPMQTVAIQAQVDGPITRIFFAEGQEVTAGQPLFQIDPRPYQAAVAQAQAVLARDRAQAANAEQEAKRYASLAEKEYVTAQQYDQVRTNSAAATATLAASQAALDQARLDLQYATIRAPIGGRTGSVMVRTGNLVRANSSTPLVTINQIRPILVRFAVPARHLGAIQRAREAGQVPVSVVPTGSNDTDPTAGADEPGVRLGDTASSQGATAGGVPGAGGGTGDGVAAGPTVTGALEFVDNAVDTTTGTIMLKGTFTNRDAILWPGEFVNVTMRLALDTALTVPAAAVVSGQQGNYVFVVGADGTAEQREVTVDRMQGAFAVLRDGLQPGERVVTDGQLRLRPGAKVQVRGAPSTAPNAGRRQEAS